MDTKNQEIQNKASLKPAKSVLAGLVVGGLVGVGTILLLVPQPGEQTRAELKEGVSDLRHRTTETVNETIAQVKTKADQVKAEVQNKAQDLLIKQLDRVSDAAEDGKKALQAS